MECMMAEQGIIVLDAGVEGIVDSGEVGEKVVLWELREAEMAMRVSGVSGVYSLHTSSVISPFLDSRRGRRSTRALQSIAQVRASGPLEQTGLAKIGKGGSP